MIKPDTLRMGDRGGHVEVLQLGLNRAGYSVGAIDGIFGSRTQSALRAFQSANGLVSDAIAGPRTWSYLHPYLVGARSYTVRRGDTFFSIAARFGTTIRAISAANPTVDPMNIRVGSRLTVPMGFDVVPETVSFSTLLMQYIAEGLKLRYPFLEVGTIGSSVMGTPIYYIKIGNGDREVFYNAVHHANENITGTLLCSFIERYAAAYTVGGEVSGVSSREMYNTAVLYAVPLVNPDGADLVTGSLRRGNYYTAAKAISNAYPTIPFPAGWKANISGTDLNLQYPAGWENAREIKFAQGFTSPAPLDYVGAAPLSAPESRAVYNFTRTHNFAVTVSYHTQGEVIYWKYLDYTPPCAEETGLALSSLTGYSLENTPYASGYAGYKDWFIYEYYRPGYTIEVGRGTAPLPLGQITEIKRDNFPAMAYLLSADICV